MTCPAAIIRRYETRAQIREYLASRGCQRSLEGWRNGRCSCRPESPQRQELAAPEGGRVG